MPGLHVDRAAENAGEDLLEELAVLVGVDRVDVHAVCEGHFDEVAVYRRELAGLDDHWEGGVAALDLLEDFGPAAFDVLEVEDGDVAEGDGDGLGDFIHFVSPPARGGVGGGGRSGSRSDNISDHPQPLLGRRRGDESFRRGNLFCDYRSRPARLDNRDLEGELDDLGGLHLAPGFEKEVDR